MARSFFNPGVFHYVLLIFFTKATDAESPTSHPHQGKVLPFQAGPPKVELDGKAERILSNGKPFQVLCNIPDVLLKFITSFELILLFCYHIFIESNSVGDIRAGLSDTRCKSTDSYCMGKNIGLR